MDTLNLRPIFLPNQRADASVFWLGLGLIAAIDAVRLTMIGGVGAITWIFIVFFLAVLHTNRLRDAGRPEYLVTIPLVIGLLAKVIVGMTAMGIDYLPAYAQFAESQGLDLDDPVQARATLFDPAFQRAHQAFRQANQDIELSMYRAGAWPSTWAFWLVIVLMGRWFARMPAQR